MQAVTPRCIRCSDRLVSQSVPARPAEQPAAKAWKTRAAEQCEVDVIRRFDHALCQATLRLIDHHVHQSAANITSLETRYSPRAIRPRPAALARFRVVHCFRAALVTIKSPARTL